MKQKIHFRNGEDLKKKACELIDKCIDFKVEADYIIIEKPNNVRITCKVKNGMKTKKIFVDAFLMSDVVNLIYKCSNLS